MYSYITNHLLPYSFNYMIALDNDNVKKFLEFSLELIFTRYQDSLSYFPIQAMFLPFRLTKSISRHMRI